MRRAPRGEEGTRKFDTYLKESVTPAPRFNADAVAQAEQLQQETPPHAVDPRVEALVTDLIGRVADKWTMLVLEALTEHGELRFTRLADVVEGVSQKMLTQTLRRMERDGLIVRTVHPVVPPKVEYRLTGVGSSLGAAFCGVWLWAADNLERIEQARCAFDARKP